MSQYRIVCTTQEPAYLPNDKAHIVAVGTGLPSGYDRYWRLSDALAAMDQGDSFYTYGERSQKVNCHHFYATGLQIPTFEAKPTLNL